MTTTPRAAALPTVLAVALLLTGCGGGGAASEPASADGAPSTSSTGGAGGTPAGSGAAGDDSGGDAGTADGTGADAGTADGTGGNAPPFAATADPDTAEPSAGSLVGVTDIRLGRHDGFDRVVFEVGGEGTPGWDVRYVDAPASQGSGADVAVEGEAVLQVTLSGTGYPGDTGVTEWAGPDPLRAGDTAVVTEVVWDGTYEGTSVAFVGTSAQAPFRVYLLEEPARVVLEVADAG